MRRYRWVQRILSDWRALALEPDFPASVIADDHYAIRIDRPTTGVKAVDRFSMLDITWYEFQLERMAQGKRPKAKLNAWYAVAGTVGRLGMHAFAQRRAWCPRMSEISSCSTCALPVV